MSDTRQFVREVVARLVKRDDGKIDVCAPAVGLWRDGPGSGALVMPGQTIGLLEILGRRVRLVAPEGAAGVVVSDDPGRARAPVSFGQVLLSLDPEVQGAGIADVAAADAEGSSAGLTFKSPTSGRFYARPSPDEPPFVEAGAIIETGHTVALLEVMKTFNRVQYGGAGLPPRAKVLRVVPEDGDDVDGGAVLLELEKA